VHVKMQQENRKNDEVVKQTKKQLAHKNLLLVSYQT